MRPDLLPKAMAAVLLGTWPLELRAQVADSLPYALPPLVVSVRRADEELGRIPAAVSVIDSMGLGRGRAGLGADEVLAGVPGLYVANRYNYSLDQRISIRGFGSRANFGVRGVRVVLDGVPQTLPDGQTQLSNIDWGALARIEVLRGPAGALYGNGSGGVISLESTRPGLAPWTAAARLEAGAFGLVRWQSRNSGRSGRLGGTLSAGGFSIEGFRQHSRARTVQLNARAEYLLSSATLVAVQLAHADAPRAENPGALTRAELDARRDSAAANNILRRADKDARQSQLGASLRHSSAAAEYALALFGLSRRLDNPLATNTYVDIDRRTGGLRAVGTRMIGPSAGTRVTVGVELQHLRDDRRNRLGELGVPTDSVQLDQRERVTERGAFAQVSVRPHARWTLSAGARRDAVTFAVADRHFADGADNSGRRTMSAWSGNAGVSLLTSSGVTPYVNVSTAFETPTTTELANAPGGSGGFNQELGPQRSTSLEAGARGSHGRLAWSAAAFLGRVSDGIVQFEEVGGRAFFRNAGRLHQDGAEVAVSGAASRRLRAAATYTHARHRFAQYDVVPEPGQQPLDGKRVPGVPAHFLRLSLLAEPWAGATLDLDHSLASALYADDANAIEVAGWGAGVTNLRMTWTVNVRGTALMPLLGINNIFARKYVGSVTVNGAFGRVFEPAPGRNGYVGAEIRLGAPER